MTNNIKSIMDQLGEEFGILDNDISKWIEQTAQLESYFPSIEEYLVLIYGGDSQPKSIFDKGVNQFQGLHRSILDSDEDISVKNYAAGFVNWRMYILLNSFLLAIKEAEQKDNQDKNELEKKIVNSYYSPYFFERLQMSTQELSGLIGTELDKLKNLTNDKKDLLAATRIKKGIHATMIEEYCPTHPLTAHHLASLDQIRINSQSDIIEAISSTLQSILDQLETNS